MNVEVLGKGSFASALVHLNPGEEFVSEAGAMFRASANVDIDVTTKSRGQGGIFSGLKRLVGGESFFLSTYSIIDNSPGEVGLAPTHQGEVRVVQLDGSVDWLCAGGSYLGSTPGLRIDTEWQGMKGFFTGESIFFVSVVGSGLLIVAAFGSITELEVTEDEDLIVDTGHLVAFEDTLDYTITKAGGSWMQTWLAGEGLVMKFNGNGKILVQSHNPNEFGKSLGPLLPPR
ncbi:MAG: TIGR00266 family protein [Gemmataceae bacterium]